MLATDDPDVPRFASDPLSSAGFALKERLRDWVQAETGMNFEGVRESRLLDAVRKVFADPSFVTVEFESLLADPALGARFLERISTELTVGESYFFRNEHHFRALRETVLPEILRQNAAQREIRIWSAGCAAGEEPYSLAILLDQLLGEQLDTWRISILATDLNPEFLDRARAGQYRAWSFRQTNIHHDRHYVVPQADGFSLLPRIRSLVRFVYLNLVKDVYPSALTGTMGLDLVLFRNVAIYLRPEVTAAIIARFRRALRPGGWLLLGESEVNQAASEGFQAERFGQATFHRRMESEPTTCCATSQPSPSVLIPRASAASSAALLPAWTPLPGTRTIACTSAPRSDRAGIAPAPEPVVGAKCYQDTEQTIARISNRASRAAAHLAYCKSLLSSAEIAKAREMLALCLSEEPLLLEAQLLSAAFAEEAGDMEAAEKAYRRAIYIDRNCAMGHFHLGLLLDRQTKPKLARQCLQRAMTLTAGKPPEACVEFSEGVCYGRLRELIALFISQ